MFRLEKIKELDRCQWRNRVNVTLPIGSVENGNNRQPPTRWGKGTRELKRVVTARIKKERDRCSEKMARGKVSPLGAA